MSLTPRNHDVMPPACRQRQMPTPRDRGVARWELLKFAMTALQLHLTTQNSHILKFSSLASTQDITILDKAISLISRPTDLTTTRTTPTRTFSGRIGHPARRRGLESSCTSNKPLAATLIGHCSDRTTLISIHTRQQHKAYYSSSSYSGVTDTRLHLLLSLRPLHVTPHPVYSCDTGVFTLSLGLGSRMLDSSRE